MILRVYSNTRIILSSSLFQFLPSSNIESEPRSGNELDNLIRELIESELDYVNDLKLCKIAYIKTLSKSFDVSNIFLCWDQIISAHESALEAMSRLSVTDKYVVLKSFLDLLKKSTNLYINFCSMQTESSKNFEAKLMSDMRFRQLVNECQRNLHRKMNECLSSSNSASSLGNWYYRTLSNTKLPLTNFIIKPMQRITKYSLLFTKILEIIIKLSDGCLNNIASEVKSAALNLCEQVNDACRRKEDIEQNKRHLAWAQSHIKQSMNHDSSLELAFAAGLDEQLVLDGKLAEPAIVFDSETNCQGARQLIKAGCLSKLRSGRELVLFLFNDILLITQVRGGAILKVEDVFRSEKAQQTYYKLYRAPILMEHIRLVSVSKNRRASWVEKQSITVSFSDISSGTLYELLASSSSDKAHWIQVLEQVSDEARNARALYEERHSLRAAQRLSMSDCRGRLFASVLEANMSVAQASNQADLFETSSLRSSSRKSTCPSVVGPLVSVQLQLRRKDAIDLLQTKQENIPISDAYRTSPRQFNLKHKFSSLIIDEPVTSDYTIEFEDECTQFLIPRQVLDVGVDILDIILMNVSKYSPNRTVARRRVRLDRLIETDGSVQLGSSQQLESAIINRQQQDHLKSGQPIQMVLKLKPVDVSRDRPRRTSFLDRSTAHIIQDQDPSFDVKLRIHLQLFCDDDNDKINGKIK